MLTQSIVPVDLNALMHKNFCLLHIWYEKLRNTVLARKYKILSQEILTAIENVTNLYDNKETNLIKLFIPI